MKAYQVYKHLINTNSFNISKKIKDFRKSNKNDNKARKTKN